jgi:hypothetical protein
MNLVNHDLRAWLTEVEKIIEGSEEVGIHISTKRLSQQRTVGITVAGGEFYPVFDVFVPY